MTSAVALADGIAVEGARVESGVVGVAGGVAVSVAELAASVAVAAGVLAAFGSSSPPPTSA